MIGKERYCGGSEASEQKHSEQQNPFGVFYDNYLDTAACTECTGLMPKAARNREEWDAYREIFDFTPEQLHSGERSGV